MINIGGGVMMILQALTKEGLDYLKGNISENLSRYQEKDKAYFADKFASRGYLMYTGVEIEDFKDNLVFSEDDKQDDLHNAKVLHEGMRNLPLYVAVDESVWGALNHTYLFDYICNRRREKLAAKEIDVANSFFSNGSNGLKRSLYINCVSRLWWVAHLLYDSANKEDPYYLLEVVARFGFPGVSVGIFSSNFIARSENAVGLFRVFHEVMKQHPKVTRDDLTAGVRYLNLIGATTMLDALDIEEIKQIMRGFYSRHFAN